MRRILLFYVMLFCATTLFAGTAPAGTALYTTDGYKAMVLEDGSVAITWIYNEGEVTIPAEVTDNAEESTGTYKVSKVGATWAICDNGKITKLILSEGITSIGQTAFWGMSSITSLSLPSTLEAIGSYAFGDCTGLQEIVCSASQTPTLGDDVFKTSATDKDWDYIGKQCKLMVPMGCLANYQNTGTWTYWDSFVQVGEMQPSSVNQVKANIPQLNKGIYTLSGQKVSDVSDKKLLPKGIYIINGKKVIR